MDSCFGDFNEIPPVLPIEVIEIITQKTGDSEVDKEEKSNNCPFHISDRIQS